jgi:HAD superfamily hydrolase (TIGR01509 family)
MDGVLIDAKEWHYEALNRALGLFGYSISRYDHLVTYDGLPTRRKLEMLTREQGLPLPLHSFLNELKQIYTMEIVHTRCKPVFQHERALSTLKSQGYTLAVASNSIRASIDAMMEKSNLLPYLSLIMSNQDVERGKPDPEIYLKSFQRLGFAPQECLVVEDNEHGIRAARSSGAHLLAVRDVHDVHVENIVNAIRAAEASMAVIPAKEEATV